MGWNFSWPHEDIAARRETRTRQSGRGGAEGALCVFRKAGSARNMSQKLLWRTPQTIRQKPCWRISCAERDSRGLGGIHPQAGAVFRPLLGVRREELRTYLRARNTALARGRHQSRHQTNESADSSESSCHCLQKKFQPAVVEHLCQLAELAREDEAFLDAQVAEWRKRHSDTDESNPRRSSRRDWPICSARARKGACRSTGLLRQIVQSMKPRSGQLGAVHVEAVLELAAQKDSGKALHLPGGVEVRRDRDSLRFRASRTCWQSQRSKVDTAPVCVQDRFALAAGHELPLVELSCRLPLQGD